MVKGKNVYKGPVLYIVHPELYDLNAALDAPVDFDIKKLQDAHNKAIETAVELAIKKDVPIFFDPSAMDPFAVKSWQKKDYDDSEKAFKGLVSRVKGKMGTKKNPQITYISLFTAGEKEKKIRNFMKRYNPSNITCIGTFRDACVLFGAIKMRNYFPDTKIHIIEGASSIHVPSSTEGLFAQLSKKSGYGGREKYLKKCKEHNIKRSKRLFPKRHFA